MCSDDFNEGTLPLERLVELAWAAGFADGEACISLARQTYKDVRRRPTFRLRFDVVQNHREVLTTFQRCVGIAGRLYATRRTAKTNRQTYQLTYDGRTAYAVIRRLVPWLVRKKPEAQVAMAYFEFARPSWHPGRRGCPAELWRVRESYYTKLRRMK